MPSAAGKGLPHMRPIQRLGLLVGLILGISVVLPATVLATTSETIDGTWQAQGSATPTATPGVYAVHDSGVGVATNVGSYTLAASEFASFTTGEISDGSWTLTTPAGDTLAASYAGSLSWTGPAAITFASPGQITGGSGRFAGATGTIVFSGTADMTTGHIIGSFVASLNR